MTGTGRPVPVRFVCSDTRENQSRIDLGLLATQSTPVYTAWRSRSAIWAAPCWIWRMLITW